MTRVPAALLALAVGFGLAGCSKEATPAASASGGPALKKVRVQLDWIAEPEHGGFYEAQAKGYFKAEGLDVELIPGGPNAFVMPKIATGQADIGQSDSTNVLLADNQDLPVVMIGAVFQNDPSVLMLHADNPVSKFEDLNGKSIMARPEWAFLPFLRKKYHIDFQIIPQNFAVGNFIADQNFIQQGFYIAEPYHIVKGGAKYPKFLYAWDAGFDAYTVLIANAPWAKANPETVKAFMRAYIHGSRDYVGGDPAPAHALMKQANPNDTDEFMAFSRKMIVDEKLVIGRGAKDDANVGQISPERIKLEIAQLEDLDILKPRGKLTPEKVVSTEYLPAAVPSH